MNFKLKKSAKENNSQQEETKSHEEEPGNTGILSIEKLNALMDTKTKDTNLSKDNSSDTEPKHDNLTQKNQGTFYSDLKF